MPTAARGRANQVINFTGITIPKELLAQFKQDLRIVNIGIKNGAMMFPDHLLDQLGIAGTLRESGLSVVIVAAKDIAAITRETTTATAL